MSILNPESLSVSPPSNHVRGAVTLVKRAIKDTTSHSAKTSSWRRKKTDERADSRPRKIYPHSGKKNKKFKNFCSHLYILY
jgi:hypothetical protein